MDKLGNVTIPILKRDQDELLKNMLKSGRLSDKDKIVLKKFYTEHYEPLKGETKKDFEDVDIRKNTSSGYSSDCFWFKLKGNDDYHSISTKYLKKSSKNTKKSEIEREEDKDRSILNETLRKLIADQVNEWKNKNIKTRPAGNQEADHYPKSFKEISDEFIKLNDGKIFKSNEEKKHKTLSKKYEDAWKKYHLENANFRWIRPENNRPGPSKSSTSKRLGSDDDDDDDLQSRPCTSKTTKKQKK